MKVLLCIFVLLFASAMATMESLLSPDFHKLLKLNSNNVYGQYNLEKYQDKSKKEQRDIVECSAVSKCASAGQSCDSPWSFEFVLCMYSYCDASDMCRPYHQNGQMCSYSEMGRECQLNSSCIGGGCFGNSKPGSYCSSNSDCTLFTMNNTIEHNCVNNQCTGFAVNQTCKWDVYNPQAQCSKGMTCDIINERCIPLKSLGQSCFFQDCQPGLVCILGSSLQCKPPLTVGAACNYVHECGYDTCVPLDRSANNSVCAPLFSVKEGDFCKSSIDNTAFSPQCADGLACYDPSGTGVGICTNPNKKSSGSSDGDDDNSCYTQNHCSNNEICKCNTNTGDSECYGAPASPKGSFKASANLVKCAQKNCQPGEGQTQCVIEKCGGEQCAYERTILPALSHVGATPLPKCAIKAYRCANSASAVKISLLSLFVALISLL